MSRAVHAILGIALGFALGAAIGYGLVAGLSGNRHDKSLEMVMTAAFVTGPLGALLGLVIGLWRSARR